MRLVPCLLACIATGFPAGFALADGDGLATDAYALPWTRLQGRIAYAASVPEWRSELAGFQGSGLKVRGVSVMGDIYFGAESASHARNGFRATSGILFGSHNQLWGSSATASPGASVSVDRRLFGQVSAAPGILTDSGADAGTLPYIGIGYSSLVSRSGWSFSADLGVVSLSPGSAVRLGRVFGGGQSLDDVVRDMRLTPVLQLGVSYAF